MLGFTSPPHKKMGKTQKRNKNNKAHLTNIKTILKEWKNEWIQIEYMNKEMNKKMNMWINKWVNELIKNEKCKNKWKIQD